MTKILTIKVNKTTKKYLHNINTYHAKINYELKIFINESYSNGFIKINISNDLLNEGSITFSKTINEEIHASFSKLCETVGLSKKKMTEIFFSWLLNRYNESKHIIR